MNATLPRSGFTPGIASFDNDGVRMSARREMRLRHVSDTWTDADQALGGDTLGHWNVTRINRLLDAFDAPIVRLPIARETMVAMARVGAPDAQRAGRYAGMGVASMPPLSFVAVRGAPDAVTSMLVDGHHRMLALSLLDAKFVPARVLPPSLADDVRIVEMSEAAVFPAHTLPKNEVDLGRLPKQGRAA